MSLDDPMINRGWIGVDLDGCLAKYDGWKGCNHIGDPVSAMLDRVKQWLAEGKCVKIFTARICDDSPAVRGAIDRWCNKHVGQTLEIVNQKDYDMKCLWDDRCVTVEKNTGKILTVGAEQISRPRHIMQYPRYHIFDDQSDHFTQTLESALKIFYELDPLSGRQVWREDSETQDTMLRDSNGGDVSLQGITCQYPRTSHVPD